MLVETWMPSCSKTRRTVISLTLTCQALINTHREFSHIQRGPCEPSVYIRLDVLTKLLVPTHSISLLSKPQLVGAFPYFFYIVGHRCLYFLKNVPSKRWQSW